MRFRLAPRSMTLGDLDKFKMFSELCATLHCWRPIY